MGLWLHLLSSLTAELLCSRPTRESPPPLPLFVLFQPVRKMNLLVSVELPCGEVGPEREPLLLPSAGQEREQECSSPLPFHSLPLCLMNKQEVQPGQAWRTGACSALKWPKPALVMRSLDAVGCWNWLTEVHGSSLHISLPSSTFHDNPLEARTEPWGCIHTKETSATQTWRAGC